MIIVTGGSGQAGRACVADLREHGYDVVAVDLVPPADKSVAHSRVDLTSFGQTIAAFSGIDDRVRGVTGIVHLAAIRAPGLAPNHVTFATNTVSTYNVFEAARQLGIKNVVWASSETVLGLPFDDAVYPNVPRTREIDDHETLLSVAKASRVLGYEPRHLA